MCWRIVTRVVLSSITDLPSTDRAPTPLVASNRAAAFGEAARWLLHEIRSPVQTLTLLADLLDDPEANIEATLRDSSRHLNRTLELLSRVVHPSTPLEPGPVSVGDVVGFIKDLHRVSRTHVRLETELDPALPPAVGVERHLSHALLNLLLNAVRACQDRRHGVIRIAARAVGHRIEIAVTDGGRGVDPALSDRLFSPELVRWSDTRLTGAGLLVAREVLRSSGGSVEARPRAEGAEFVISLPTWQQAPAPPG